MPSASSNEFHRAFCTEEKLRLFDHYSDCVRDNVAYITDELSRTDGDPRHNRDLCRILRDTLNGFMDEIHYWTEQCVLPPCPPAAAAALHAKRNELRELARSFAEPVAFLNKLELWDGPDSAAVQARADDVETEDEEWSQGGAVLELLEANLRAELEELNRR